MLGNGQVQQMINQTSLGCRNSRDELARIPRSGIDCAAAAKIGGSAYIYWLYMEHASLKLDPGESRKACPRTRCCWAARSSTLRRRWRPSSSRSAAKPRKA